MYWIASRIEVARLEARMTQKELNLKLLKEYKEINMYLWDDNIKMDIKETSFVFRLN